MGAAAPSDPRILVRRLHPQAALPCRMTPESAGMDLSACLTDGPIHLAPGGRALVPTGLAMALPPGLEAQVRPRSGLALRHGVTVLNAPGTIDSDYRGEVSVLLVNHGDDVVVVAHGDRIAQMVVATVCVLPVEEVDELAATQRGDGGYGSTGI
jgi:dUTP pyrophosphatase